MSLAVGMMLSCSSNDDSCNKVMQENDSLRHILAENDSVMNTISGAYGEIEKNVVRIEAKKALINEMAGKKKLTKAEKELILAEMDSIQSLLQLNRERVSDLEGNVSGNGNLAGMEHIIKGMNEMNESEDLGVKQMKRDLAQISQDFSDLFEEFVYTEAENMEMKEQLSSKAAELEAAKARLESTKERLYSGWYVVGTDEELKAKGIVYTKGLFGSADVNQDFDKSQFRKVNILDFKEIILNGRKATIISTHPSESFELQGIKRRADKLIIKDPEKFWSVSKFLIIEVE